VSRCLHIWVVYLGHIGSYTFKSVFYLGHKHYVSRPLFCVVKYDLYKLTSVAGLVGLVSYLTPILRCVLSTLLLLDRNAE